MLELKVIWLEAPESKNHLSNDLLDKMEVSEEDKAAVLLIERA